MLPLQIWANEVTLLIILAYNFIKELCTLPDDDR
jgi:hypothetical protein